MIPSIFLLLFLIISAFLCFKIHIGFALVVSCYILVLPFVKVNIGPIGIFFSNAVYFVTVLSFCARLFLGQIRRQSYSNIFMFSIIVLFVMNMLVVFLSKGVAIPTQIVKIFYFLILPISLCIIAWYIYDSKEKIRAFVCVISVTTVLTTVYGVFCYMTMSNPILELVDLTMGDPTRAILSRMEEARGGLVGRTQSTMNHALSWGGTCLILFYFFKDKSDIHRLFKTIIIFLVVINIFLSGSRSSMLGFICMLMAYFCLMSDIQKIKVVKYSILAIIILIIFLPMTSFYEKYQGIIESTIFFWDKDVATEYNIQGSTIEMRLNQLIGAFKLIDGSTFAGLGHGYVEWYQNKYGLHPVLFGFESIVFQKIVDNGILGIFIWAYFFIKLFYTPHKIATYGDKQLIQKVHFLQAYVVGYLVFALLTGFMATFVIFLLIYTIQMKIISLDSVALNHKKNMHDDFDYNTLL